MKKYHMERCWEMFLELISENNTEKKFLTKIVQKQAKKIIKFNKKIALEAISDNAPPKDRPVLPQNQQENQRADLEEEGDREKTPTISKQPENIRS